MEELWSIIEFEDGLAMIPTSWVTENKSAARWPPFTSQLKFAKAVQKRISHGSDWSLHTIKRILATSNSYDKGLIKLKKAEFLSDINSENDDFEDIKKSRKNRAKKPLPSSDDTDSDQENNVLLPHYPKIPQIKCKSFYTKSKNLDDASKKQPIKEAVTTCEEKELEKSGDSYVCEIENRNNSDSIFATRNNDNKNNEPCTKRYTSDTCSTSSDFQRYIIRKLTDVGFQLSSLQEQGKVLNSRLDTILQTLQISHPHGTEGETVEQDVMNNFPFENMEDLETFEKLLIEGHINRQKLIIELSRIGGSDIRKIVFNLLRTLFTDKLACMFNYIGGKKKRIFHDLEIRKVIFSVVRIHFTNATEQIIAEPIKSWLRHANERYQKKTKDNTDKHAATTIDTI